MLEITNIEEQEERFRVDSDSKAEWALKEIRKRQAEHDRLVELARVEIEELKTQIECFDSDLENGTKWLRSQLAEYMQTVECSETKTQSKYKLLSGELILKKSAYKIEKVDDTELVAYLERTGNEEYLKVEKKAAWGDFKKVLQMVDGQVVNSETGEVLPIEVVKVEETAPEFSVKLK